MFSFLDEHDVKAGETEGGRTWSEPGGKIIMCYLSQYLLRGRVRLTRTHAEEYISHVVIADTVRFFPPSVSPLIPSTVHRLTRVRRYYMSFL